MAAAAKDTIYIDIDDEITGIIDKLRASNGKVVALVLPKRATVLQSIVNMKLLKRAADDSKKNIVLITTETGLLPLAGAAGLHVASSLTSKPAIPLAPDQDENEETVDEDAHDIPEVTDEDREITAKTAGAVAVGALAGLPPKEEMETLELDDDEADAVADTTAAGAAATTVAASKRVKKDKHLKVPNFERFRLLLIIGGALLILFIVLAITGNRVLPKASIDIKTDATALNSSLTLNLSTTATTVNLSNNTLPAKQVQIKKTYTQSANATGQQNNGQKASGKVEILNCTAGQPVSIPANTAVVAKGYTYLTTDAVSIPVGSATCKDIPGATSEVVGAVALKGGAGYNSSSNGATSGSAMSVAGGYGTSVKAYVSTEFTGGTDNIVTVLSQTDIDSAKNKISTDDASVKQDLQNQLTQGGYYPMPVTFNSGTPTVTTSANAGDAVSSVTVTEVVTYSMMGVHEADLKAVVDNSVKSQMDTSKQKVLDEGLSSATYNLQGSTDTTAQVAMQTVVVVGPQLDENQIKQEVAGKKSGEATSIIQANPDVTNVTIKLSPFWVTSIPKNTDKITITIEKPTAPKSSNASSTNP